jgi:hypothetical protein
MKAQFPVQRLSARDSRQSIVLHFEIVQLEEIGALN